MNDLRERRKARGLTLADVANAAKTTPVTISRYERGKRKPSVKMAKVLGPLYGVPWTDFYKDVA